MPYWFCSWQTSKEEGKIMNYGFTFNDTPRDQILTMMRYYQDRNDKRDADRRNSYMNLMQMLGRGVGAYMYGKNARDKAAANAAWDAYMPDAQELYNNELIGKVQSYDDTVNKLQMLGLNPYLADIDKLRNIGADAEFDDEFNYME